MAKIAIHPASSGPGPRPLHGWIGPVWVLLVLLLCASPSRAEVRSIQERTHGGIHELAAGLGYLPLDPFTKGLAGTLSYGWSFSEAFTWRALDLRYAGGFDTTLKEDLLWAGQATPDEFERPELFGTSELQLEPFYGRETLLNRGDVHLALVLLAGGGVALLRNDADERSLRPALSLGGGLRIWITRFVSMRLEVKEYLIFDSWSPASALSLDLALAVQLGRRSAP